jgi:hypothetical protein
LLHTPAASFLIVGSLLLGWCRLTNNQLVVIGDFVLGDLEVQRGGAFPDAARDVVVRTVAGAEPTAEVAGLADGHATKVCADAYGMVYQQNRILFPPSQSSVFRSTYPA